MKKIIYVICLLSFISNYVFCQTDSLINNHLLNLYFNKISNGKQLTRKFVDVSKNKSVLKIVGGTLIYFYQNVLSEQIQADCIYEISCSDYLKFCISKYGFLKGTFAGIHQYTKCNGHEIYNHYGFRKNPNGKIINLIGDEIF